MTAEELETPAAPTRIGAFLLDFLLMTVAALLLWGAFTALQFGIGRLTGMLGLPDAATLAVVGVVRILMWVVIGGVMLWYFAGMGSPAGRTYGKRILDLTVVDDEGAVPERRSRFVKAAVLLAPVPILALLNIVGTVYGFLLALPVVVAWLLLEGLVMGLAEDGRRIGDRVAGTRVVPADD